MKRLIALFLAFASIFSMTSMIVWAEEEATVEANTGTPTIESTNDLGDMVADAINKEHQAGQNAAYETAYSIYDVEIAENAATVSYATLEDAELVVAIYTDDGKQMITSVSETVTADADEVILTFETPLPDTFFVKAYLLDTYDYSPLATAFETPMYTAAMQELLASEASDFADKNVLQMDEREDTNFAVYNDDVYCIPYVEGINTVASIDDDNHIYVIENADTNFTTLSPGTIIAYSYGEDEIIITRVAEIAEDGTTVTITGSPVSMEEVFSHVKIQQQGSNGDLEVNDVDPDDGISMVQPDETVSPATRAKVNNIPVKLEIEAEFESKFSDNVTGKVSVSGSLDMDLDVTFEYYGIGPVYFLDLYVDVESTVSVEVSGELDVTLTKLPSFGFSPMIGLYIGFDPEVQIKVSAKIQLDMVMTFGVGAKSYSGILLYKGRGIEMKDADSYMEGKVFFGVNLKPYVAAVHKKILRLELTAPVGIEITGRMTGLNHDTRKTPATRHTCNDCLDISIDVVASAKVVFELFNCKNLSLKVTVAEGKIHIADMYWSFDHEELKTGACPHLDYRQTFEVITTGDVRIEGAEIKTSAGDVLGTTDKNGILTAYLEKGTYTFTTFIDKEPIVVTKKVDTSYKHVLTNDPEIKKAYEHRAQLMVQPAAIKNHTPRAEGTSGGTEWILYMSGQLIIKGEGGMGGYSYSDPAPWYSYRDYITSIVVEDGVTSVGSYAFYDLPNVSQIILSTTAVTLGKNAICNLPNLQRLQVPVDYTFEQAPLSSCPSLHTIHYNQGKTGVMRERTGYTSETIYCGNALEYAVKNSLKSVIMDEGVLKIASYAFYDCTKLTEVYFPVSYETVLSDYAFYNCQAITKIDLPFTLTYLGKYAFYNCENLLYIKLPITVTSIGAYCFQNCKAMTSLTIPDSVTFLGGGILYGSGVTDITLPIDYYFAYRNQPFTGCGNVETVHYTYGKTGVMPDRNHTTNDDKNYEYTLEYIARDSLQTVTFDSQITKIGNYGFYQCAALTSVTLPEKLTTIGSYAFYGIGLQSIDLQNTEIIGEYAFGESKLTSVRLGEKVTSVGSYAYYKCTGLVSVNIPDHLGGKVGNRAFCGCTNIKTVTVPVDLFVSQENAYIEDWYSPFYGCSNIETIHYTPGLTGQLTDRQTSDRENNYYGFSLEYACKDSLKQVRFNEGITHIGNYAFYNCTNLETVVLPESLESIGNYAFYNTGVKTVDLKQTANIGEEAFANSQLTIISLPDTLESVGAYAFNNCTNLVSVKIPNHMGSKVANRAFAGCTGLRTVTVPVDLFVSQENMYIIDWYSPFYGCSGIETIHYTPGLTGKMIDRQTSDRENNYYGFSLEYSCKDSLKQVRFNEGITHIGNYAFYECTNLETVVLPETLESIGIYAFYNTGVKTVDLKQTATIGEEAFANSQIAKLDLPDTLESIGAYAFNNCTNLVSVKIPNHMGSKVANRAFAGCTGLRTVTVPVDLFVSQENMYIIDWYSPFYGCSNIETIYYTPGLTGKMIDRQTSNRENNYYGFSLEYACRNSLKTVHFAKGITRVGAYAFYDCTALTQIYFAGDAPGFGNYAFYNVTATVYYPAGNSSWTSAVMQNYGGTITWSANSNIAVTGVAQSGGTSGSNGVDVPNSTRAIHGGSYSTDLTETASVTTAIFENLAPGKEYVLLAVANMEAENFLSADNLLYIQQAAAGEDGTLTFAFIMRDAGVDGVSYIMACGPSNKDLKDAQIVFPEMYAGESVQVVDPVVTYDGQILKEELDYVLLGEVDYTQAGTYICYVRGVREYTGWVACTYVVGETCAHTYSYTDNGDGTHTGTCTCGHTVIGEHSYEAVSAAGAGSACTECGHTVFAWAGMAVSLESSLQASFVVQTSKLPAEGYYAVVEKEVFDKTSGEISVETTRFEAADFVNYNTAGTMKKIVFSGVAAKQMTDRFTVTIYNADGEQISASYTRTIEEYILGLLTGTSTKAAMKVVCVDFLNYGAAAQDKFGYRTTELANRGLTDDMKALATADSAVAGVTDARVKGALLAGTAVAAEFEIIPSTVYQTSKIANVVKAEVSYVNFKGVTVSYEVAAADFANYNTNGTMKKIEIKGTAVADGASPITVKLIDANGNVVDETVECVNYYCARMAADHEVFNKLLKVIYSAKVAFA